MKKLHILALTIVLACFCIYCVQTSIHPLGKYTLSSINYGEFKEQHKPNATRIEKADTQNEMMDSRENGDSSGRVYGYWFISYIYFRIESILYCHKYFCFRLRLSIQSDVAAFRPFKSCPMYSLSQCFPILCRRKLPTVIELTNANATYIPGQGYPCTGCRVTIVQPFAANSRNLTVVLKAIRYISCGVDLMYFSEATL